MWWMTWKRHCPVFDSSNAPCCHTRLLSGGSFVGKWSTIWPHSSCWEEELSAFRICGFELGPDHAHLLDLVCNYNRGSNSLITDQCLRKNKLNRNPLTLKSRKRALSVAFALDLSNTCSQSGRLSTRAHGRPSCLGYSLGSRAQCQTFCLQAPKQGK